MADLKISDLPAAASSSGAMQVEVNDGGVSKRITVDQIKAFVIPAGSIADAQMAVGAITTTKISDSAVATAKIADAAVTSIKIADAAITAAKLATNSVTTAKIADGNVTTAKIQSNAIQSFHIGTGAVTNDKLINSGVNSGNYGSASKIPVLTVDSKGLITAASEADAPGGMILLGTIDTTSGTTKTLALLDLTPYKQVQCVVNGVSSSTTSGTFRITDPSGTLLNLATVSSTQTNRIAGILTIDLGTGVMTFTFRSNAANTTPNFDAGSVAAGITTFTSAESTLTFSLSTGSFDAGSIRVYGVK